MVDDFHRLDSNRLIQWKNSRVKIISTLVMKGGEIDRAKSTPTRENQNGYRMQSRRQKMVSRNLCGWTRRSNDAAAIAARQTFLDMVRYRSCK